MTVKSLQNLKRAPLPPLARIGVAQPRTVAAGHSRGGNGGGGGHQGGGGSHNSGSMSQGSYGGGGGLSGGGGGILGGGGGPGGGGSMNPGGGGGGRGGGNYGPSSPPTGSLPPFYESLKGGGLGGTVGGGGFNNGPQYMNNGNGGGGNYNMMQLPMDCDTGQGQEGGGLYGGSGSLNSKQYSLLQNVGASYGLITVKEDEDESILGSAGNYSQYEDSMLVDIATGAVVDPLQFTATLTFSSPADHNALLESLSDDLFLQRMSSSSPEDASDLLPEPTTSLNSSIPGPIEPTVDPFPEHNALGLTQRSNYNDTSRNFAAPTHFTKNTMFLNNNNNNNSDSGNGSSNFHNLPKERPELALHISSGSSQQEPMQQLQVST